jgi:hypothetical protein
MEFSQKPGNAQYSLGNDIVDSTNLKGVGKGECSHFRPGFGPLLCLKKVRLGEASDVAQATPDDRRGHA